MQSSDRVVDHATRAPTTHRTPRALGALPIVGLGAPMASSAALAFTTVPPFRAVWGIVSLGCLAVLLLWASTRRRSAA